MTHALRRIVFITGTRADFGKMKNIIAAVEAMDEYECVIFATGMHTLELYGNTIDEVRKANFKNVYAYINQTGDEPMDLILAATIEGFSHFVQQHSPDLIIIHGDRVEALAGATVGALRNVRVAHVEGGELSGTVDELIRHAVSKLSHLHFVANEEAARRLRQMGEKPESIFIIGSPEVDVMTSSDLPELVGVKAHYKIDFDRYSIAIFHPVTTEVQQMAEQAANFFDALLETGHNFVLIYPNNDVGTSAILHEFQRVKSNPKFRTFPSIRFENFLTLLKHARYIVGNSSSGVREAPFYGCPTVNVGTRQMDRFTGSSIFNTATDKASILEGIEQALAAENFPPNTHFGSGNSIEQFLAAFDSDKVWDCPQQKQFVDIRSDLKNSLKKTAST